MIIYLYFAKKLQITEIKIIPLIFTTQASDNPLILKLLRISSKFLNCKKRQNEKQQINE